MNQATFLIVLIVGICWALLILLSSIAVVPVIWQWGKDEWNELLFRDEEDE